VTRRATEPRRPAATPPERDDDATDIDARIRAVDWSAVAASLDDRGHATTGALLRAEECAALVAMYAQPAGFRSRVVMARHGYGRGEYRYFDYPLPPLVAALRDALYGALAPVANRWMEALGRATRYPATHRAYLEQCHARGQTKPTPLLLRYGPGDYNCLHQDLYGDEVFPLQTTFLLADPRRDFRGGELCLTTSRPRRQSRVDVVPLRLGEGAIFAVRDRPEAGPRGWRKVTMRHGVSLVRSGSRTTLGVILHDAQ
jgi:hypothetical protein